MKKGSGMRQLLAVLLAVWMAAAGALGAAAQEEKKQVAMSFTARSALLMEQQTGKVLFSQNETQRVAPASLTKLMDLLLIFQQLQSGKLTMEQELTCSAYAKTMGGSEIWLKEGERMTVEELLKALGGGKRQRCGGGVCRSHCRKRGGVCPADEREGAAAGSAKHPLCQLHRL